MTPKQEVEAPMSKPRYSVLTFDSDLGKFTPQVGLRRGPWSKWGLRKVLRRLRELGYEGNRGDNSVLIERIEAPQ